MKRVVTVLAIGGLLALAGALSAQEADESGAKCTVQPGDVKTWTMDVEGKEWSVRTAAPSYAGDTGLFHLSSAYTLPKGKVSASYFYDNLDRDPKDVDVGIHGINIGFGATSKLEVFGQIGIQNRVNVDAGFQAGYVDEYPFAGTSATSPGWQTGFGDVWVGAKFKILDDYLGDGVGLAVRGRVKLPTADDEKGLGTGKASGDADLILSKHLNRKADLHAAIGYQFNSDPDDVGIGNALKWGVGVNVPACQRFQLQAEVSGKVYSGGDFEEATNPVDVVIGPAVWLGKGFFIRPAIGFNLAFDDRGLNSGFKSYAGGQVSVGYHPGTPCCEIYVPPPPPPPPVNRPPTVALSCESPILAGLQSTCRATASDPDGDPLTYAWAANGGSVTGSDASATFDSQGVTAPATVTVTVKVSDGRGGTADAQAPIKIESPPPAEPITCTSGGFPRNLSRLNNVDKACLDDVASRLRQDPRGRVVVVGHADSKERYPEVIGRTRAEAIKDYLVKERGIEESRISTRSAAATKPLDTGTSAPSRAKNRRVEIIFLPEGAMAPEEQD
jgi:outer membrane protein OmpA-like peptidoglycan-associated protein